MKRDIIKIEENAIRVTGCDVWMSEPELVGLFGYDRRGGLCRNQSHSQRKRPEQLRSLQMRSSGQRQQRGRV